MLTKPSMLPKPVDVSMLAVWVMHMRCQAVFKSSVQKLCHQLPTQVRLKSQQPSQAERTAAVQVMAARQGEPSASGALEASESADLGQEEEPALEEGLTDAQLMEVFKQTSIFNVKSALANNENLVHAEAEDELQTDLISDSDLSDTDEWEYLRGFWSGMSFFGGKAKKEILLEIVNILLNL